MVGMRTHGQSVEARGKPPVLSYASSGRSATRHGDKEVMAAIIEESFSLIVCNVPVVVTSLLALRRARSRANTSETTDVQFASWPTNRRSTIVKSATSFTGTIATNWGNTFRWERDLQETGELNKTELSNTVDVHLSNLHDRTTTTTKDIQVTVSHEGDVVRQKQSWHFQGSS
ncbi:hypothetical protein H0H92_011640 [Tricholoma furcatifolium]|nr:hypothetical protein H0H92_011640 [Tricholoma furcatifolium]